VYPGSLPEIVTGEFAPRRLEFWPPHSMRVIDWNIDRGLHLEGIIDFLAACDADLILLQEADLNARRTRHRNIAEDIARDLRMNYVFAREFEELLEGSPSSPAYHGQATLSRFRLNQPRILHFHRQSHFWQPHWFVPRIHPFQIRRGGRIALFTEVEAAGRRLVTYNLHLESRGASDLRFAQLEEALSDASRVATDVPVLLGGDLNLNAASHNIMTKLRGNGFRDALAGLEGPTISRKLLIPGRRIDWEFLRGPVSAERPEIHRRVHASDHFPLTFTLIFSGKPV
jgi:endonuclease/exonuclease/phosphatase family metal-dependent hydrolase